MKLKDAKTKGLNEWHRLQLLQDTIAPKLISRHKFTGNAVVTADYHIPCVDIDMVKYAIEKGKEYNIKQLFIAGDFFNFDVLSYYTAKLGGSDTTIKMRDELKMGKEIMQSLSTQFDRIVYSIGNHENRWSKAVRNAFTFEMVTDWLKQGNLKFLNSFFFYLDDIRVIHPKSYSQVKLSVAMRMCDKFQCPVINAHGHFSSTGFSRSGYQAVDLGVMCDWERIEYMTKADTTHPRWNPAFVVYHDKQIYNYAKGYGLK